MKEEKIKELLDKGENDAAIDFLNIEIARSPKDDALYYLLGNIYRKKGLWKEAIQSYLEAMDINPDSPAKEAHQMVMNILNFYNKDLYNQ